MPRGGKRQNAGRKRGEPKIRVFIPVSLWEKFQLFESGKLSFDSKQEIKEPSSFVSLNPRQTIKVDLSDFERYQHKAEQFDDMQFALYSKINSLKRRNFDLAKRLFLKEPLQPKDLDVSLRKHLSLFRDLPEKQRFRIVEEFGSLASAVFLGVRLDSKKIVYPEIY